MPTRVGGANVRAQFEVDRRGDGAAARARVRASTREYARSVEIVDRWDVQKKSCYYWINRVHVRCTVPVVLSYESTFESTKVLSKVGPYDRPYNSATINDVLPYCTKLRKTLPEVSISVLPAVLRVCVYLRTKVQVGKITELHMIQ